MPEETYRELARLGSDPTDEEIKAKILSLGFVKRAIEESVNAEREACAQLCEQTYVKDYDHSQRKHAGKDIAKLIRARREEKAETDAL